MASPIRRVGSAKMPDSPLGNLNLSNLNISRSPVPAKSAKKSKPAYGSTSTSRPGSPVRTSSNGSKSAKNSPVKEARRTKSQSNLNAGVGRLDVVTSKLVDPNTSPSKKKKEKGAKVSLI